MALRIAYFGLPLGALVLAEDGHELGFAVISPIEAPGLRRLQARLGDRVLLTSELGDSLNEEVQAAFERQPADLLVSWFWTRRLPTTWLEAPRLGAIGVHPSLLPRHRGRNPYFWAIDAGDQETGVSVHRLEAEYDTGAILMQERLRVGERNAWQLARALDRPSLRCLRQVTRSAEHGLAQGVAQDSAQATQAPEPDGEWLRADFSWDTARVLRRIRALSPVPGLALSLSDVAFFVTAAHPSPDFTRALAPGEAEIAPGRLSIRTADGAIVVEKAVLAPHGEHEEAEEVSGSELAEHLAERLSLARGSSFKDVVG